MSREAAKITEQIRVTGSEGTGEGVSHAAAVDADAAGEVEPAGHFRSDVRRADSGGAAGAA